jgi:hypothetical protein
MNEQDLAPFGDIAALDQRRNGREHLGRIDQVQHQSLKTRRRFHRLQRRRADLPVRGKLRTSSSVIILMATTGIGLQVAASKEPLCFHYGRSTHKDQ